MLSPKKIQQKMIAAQKNEITEYHIYLRLSEFAKDESNKKILKQIAEDELKHYHFWKNLTKKETPPNRKKIEFFYFVSQVLGISFGLRLMEKGERVAQKNYAFLSSTDLNLQKIIRDECEHEEKLLNLIEDKSLSFSGSVVLGLSDALVELTGALAGLTLALQNTRLIAVVGLVTGIAASMSMAGSEYLSKKEEGDIASARNAAFFTGISYIFTVFILVLPYFLITNPFISLAITIGLALCIILSFTFYTATARNVSFPKKFIEMTTICLGVATISFVIGFVVNNIFDIQI